MIYFDRVEVVNILSRGKGEFLTFICVTMDTIAWLFNHLLCSS